MEEITIRRVGPDEWESWREIRLRALTESPEAFASSVRTVAATQDHEHLWRARIANAVACWLALEVDRPVGLVALDAMDDGRVQLVSMFVAAEARGRGVGAALVDAVVAAAGDAPLHLRVMAGNEAAIRCYERAGFRLEPAAPDCDGCLAMIYADTRSR